jgi:hypothetical protein
MYATVRVYKSGDQRLTDALVERQDEVKRIMGELDGFNGYYLIRTADGAVSISVFESQASAEASTNVAASWIKDNLPDLPMPAPEVSTGEVVISAG